MKTMWMQRVAAAAVLVASAGWSQAGTVSVSVDSAQPFVVGETVIFTVRDTVPRDMFVAFGVVAADFSLQYDTSALEFLSFAYPSWMLPPSPLPTSLSVLGNDVLDLDGAPTGEVLVNFFGLDESDLPADPADLFHVSFTVKSALGGFVSLAPPDPDEVPYVFGPSRFDFTIDNGSVPEPSTLALLAAALWGAGRVGRRRNMVPCPSSC